MLNIYLINCMTGLVTIHIAKNYLLSFVLLIFFVLDAHSFLFYVLNSFAITTSNIQIQLI